MAEATGSYNVTISPSYDNVEYSTLNITNPTISIDSTETTENGILSITAPLQPKITLEGAAEPLADSIEYNLEQISITYTDVEEAEICEYVGNIYDATARESSANAVATASSALTTAEAAQDTADFAEQMLTDTTLTGDDYTDTTATAVKRAYYNESNTSLYLTGSMNTTSGIPTGLTEYIDRIRLTMYYKGGSEVHDVLYLHYRSWVSLVHYSSSSSTNLIESGDTLSLSTYSDYSTTMKIFWIRLQVGGTACCCYIQPNSSYTSYWVADAVKTTTSYPYSHWFCRGSISTDRTLTFSTAGYYRINTSGTPYWYTWTTDEVSVYLYDVMGLI